MDFLAKTRKELPLDENDKAKIYYNIPDEFLITYSEKILMKSQKKWIRISLIALISTLIISFILNLLLRVITFGYKLKLTLIIINLIILSSSLLILLFFIIYKLDLLNRDYKFTLKEFLVRVAVGIIGSIMIYPILPYFNQYVLNSQNLATNVSILAILAGIIIFTEVCVLITNYNKRILKNSIFEILTRFVFGIVFVLLNQGLKVNGLYFFIDLSYFILPTTFVYQLYIFYKFLKRDLKEYKRKKDIVKKFDEIILKEKDIILMEPTLDNLRDIINFIDLEINFYNQNKGIMSDQRKKIILHNIMDFKDKILSQFNKKNENHKVCNKLLSHLYLKLLDLYGKNIDKEDNSFLFSYKTEIDSFYKKDRIDRDLRLDYSRCLVKIVSRLSSNTSMNRIKKIEKQIFEIYIEDDEDFQNQISKYYSIIILNCILNANHKYILKYLKKQFNYSKKHPTNYFLYIELMTTIRHLLMKYIVFEETQINELTELSELLYKIAFYYYKKQNFWKKFRIITYTLMSMASILYTFFVTNNEAIEENQAERNEILSNIIIDTSNFILDNTSTDVEAILNLANLYKIKGDHYTKVNNWSVALEKYQLSYNYWIKGYPILSKGFGKWLLANIEVSKFLSIRNPKNISKILRKIIRLYKRSRFHYQFDIFIRELIRNNILVYKCYYHILHAKNSTYNYHLLKAKRSVKALKRTEFDEKITGQISDCILALDTAIRGAKGGNLYSDYLTEAEKQIKELTNSIIISSNEILQSKAGEKIYDSVRNYIIRDAPGEAQARQANKQKFRILKWIIGFFIAGLILELLGALIWYLITR